MGRMARMFIQSLLKVVNAGLGMVGIAMILYALWMLRAWLRHVQSDTAPIPWFIYAILGLGVILCVIFCSGHIAAETAHGCCLYVLYLLMLVTSLSATLVAFLFGFVYCRLAHYMVFVFLLFVLEAAVTADIFLNHSWEEDFPEDPSKNFDQLKHFIMKNFDICKWIGLAVVAVQGLSILLAMILKAIGPHSERHYESDDDYLPDRVPLLKNYVPQSYPVNEQTYGKNGSWNTRTNSKGSR